MKRQNRRDAQGTRQQHRRDVQVRGQRRIRIDEVAAGHRSPQEQLGLFETQCTVRMDAFGHLPNARRRRADSAKVKTIHGPSCCRGCRGRYGNGSDGSTCGETARPVLEI